MKKVVELIEQYIQWVTLVLGAAFVGLMVFRYFLQTPNIAGVSPGSIDKVTVDGPVSQLEAKKNSATLADLPVPTFTADFKAALSGPTTRPLPVSWIRSTPLPAELVPGASDVKFDPSAPTASTFQGSGPVASIPTLPAAKTVGVTQGISTVNPAVIIPAAQANLVPPPATPTAPGTTPPQPAFPGVTGVDKFWVTTAFEIPISAIAAEFTNTKVPSGLTTSFLRVELQREELLPSGAWGNTTIVKPLAPSMLAQNPLPSPGNTQAELTYKQWAESNQIEVVQPGFYQLMGGSQWTFPGAVKAAGTESVFDPLKYLTGAIPATLTPEQRDAVLQARRANAAEAERKRREERKSRAPAPGAGGPAGGDLGGPPPSRGGFRGGPGGGGSGAPFIPTPPPAFSSSNNTDGTANVLFQFRGAPGGRPPGYPPNEPWPPTGAGGADGDMGNFSGNGNPGGAVEQTNLGPINSGPFDPQTWTQANINAIQHDETAEPGKTYRYRARYLMTSPVFGQPVATSKPELATTLRWESAWSEWTANVNIPNAVSFFVASNITTNANTVTFEVFKYTNGQMRSKIFSVAPGDLIGGMEGTNDLSTGYALVDIRKDGKGQNYALIMAPDGTLLKRDVSDTKSEQFLDFKKQVTPPTTPGGNIPPR